VAHRHREALDNNSVSSPAHTVIICRPKQNPRWLSPESMNCSLLTIQKPK
ncbi:7393_t:CDS:1, partial [Paraglomus occultum]